MDYKKVTLEDISFFQALTSPEQVSSGDGIHEDFTRDEMPVYGKFSPEAVIRANNAQEVSNVMKYCFQQNIPVTPRGAGTGLCGACVPIRGGVVLSTASMNRILELDQNTMTVVVEPGVLLMQLADYLSPFSLLYPPDPGEKSATLGGNVMTNAGGMRAVKYGVTRDYVRGMDVVLADGTMTTFGGKIAKNSSGYSLRDLMVGSEGTLGIVTRLYLKVVPAPARMTSLLIPFDSIEDSLRCVPLIMQSPDTPTTLEFMEREVILDAQEYLGKDFPDQNYNAYLLASFSGPSKQEIAKMYHYTADTCLANGARDVFISETADTQDSIWSARGAFLEAISSSSGVIDECDVVVHLDKIYEFLQYTRELSELYEIRIRSFGHAGDGNLHIYLCKDDLEQERWEYLCCHLMEKMYRKAGSLNGQVSGEHGIGHSKKEYLAALLPPEQLELMRSIKRVFDPKGILNPGKIF